MTTATMTLSATTTRDRAMIRRPSASPRKTKSNVKVASPTAKPPRSSPLKQLSNGPPPRPQHTASKSHNLYPTQRRPAYTLKAPRIVPRGYRRPQPSHLAQAIDNAEKRITHLLFDPTHTLIARRRPALAGRPLLPCIGENDVYPRPLPSPALHPMERTKARRPRSRTSHVQDENQSPLLTLLLGQTHPAKAVRPRAVAYSIPRRVFAKAKVNLA